jgi:hypothetical protein
MAEHDGDAAFLAIERLTALRVYQARTESRVSIVVTELPAKTRSSARIGLSVNTRATSPF